MFKFNNIEEFKLKVLESGPTVWRPLKEKGSTYHHIIPDSKLGEFTNRVRVDIKKSIADYNTIEEEFFNPDAGGEFDPLPINDNTVEQGLKSVYSDILSSGRAKNLVNEVAKKPSIGDASHSLEWIRVNVIKGPDPKDRDDDPGDSFDPGLDVTGSMDKRSAKLRNISDKISEPIPRGEITELNGRVQYKNKKIHDDIITPFKNLDSAMGRLTDDNETQLWALSSDIDRSKPTKAQQKDAKKSNLEKTGATARLQRIVNLSQTIAMDSPQTNLARIGQVYPTHKEEALGRIKTSKQGIALPEQNKKSVIDSLPE